MLTGLLQPDKGRIQILGEDIWQTPATVKRWDRCRTRKHEFVERLTAPEYLEFVAGMYGLDASTARSRSQELLDLIRIVGQIRDPARRFLQRHKKPLWPPL